jgi:hypothetical protein
MLVSATEGQVVATEQGGCGREKVRFCRYRFCATGELKYRGAVGRRQVHCTLIVKIIRFYYLDFAKIESKSC